MPISAQKPVNVVVDAVYVPSIIISTAIDPTTKELKVSAKLSLRGASVDGDQWTDGGTSGIVIIPDLNALPSDLSSLRNQVQSIEASIISLVSAINSIRKVV